MSAMTMTEPMDGIGNAIEALRKQREIKQQQIRKLDEAIAKLVELSGDVEGEPVPRSMEFEGLGIADATKRWLAERGGKATTREISEALLARGVKTTSKNFVATVYAVLAGSPLFVRMGDGQWTVKEAKDV